MITNENNFVKIAGIINEAPKFSHEVYGNRFYSTYINCARKSGLIDRIPLVISERLLENVGDITNTPIMVQGEFRSHNCIDDNGKKAGVKMYLLARNFSRADGIKKNEIRLTGYVCKNQKCWEMSNGKIIKTLLLAVTRHFGRTDYIPCICWEENALIADKFPIGAKISVRGKVHSRMYVKKVDGNKEAGTAYEVAVAKIEEIGEEDKK